MVEKIIFLTNKKQTWTHENIEISSNPDSLLQMLGKGELTGLDTENNSLHPIYAIPLLLQFSDGITSWVIDCNNFDIASLHLERFEDNIYLTHNGQYDYMICKYHHKFSPKKMIDTMVNEQIINRGSGRFNNLDETHWRRLNIILPQPKSTRQAFSKMGKNPEFIPEHILYSAYDPYCLFPILAAQRPIIETYQLERRVFDIASPLISILGDMCLEGFTLNTEKWKQVLDENKQNKYKVECKLDEELRKLSKGVSKLTGGKWTRKRYKADGEQSDLFGESLSVANENKHNVSYSSNKDLTTIFNCLNEPIPQVLDKKSDEYGTMKNSFAEEALEQYKIEYPSSRLITFINHLLEYREIEKEINSFGENFLKSRVRDGKGKKFKRGYLNSVTGKVHTVYKQEFTKNGRLASGDNKKQNKGINIGFYNSQQLPKKNKYRNCFTLTQEEIDLGYLIDTLDLSQAELVILASNAKDPILIDILKQGKDLHGYLATIYYTKIIKYILDNMSEGRAYDEIFHLMKPNRLTESLLKKVDEDKFILYTKDELLEIQKQRTEDCFNNKGVIVDKKKFPDLRDPAKNVHYGITYGAGKEKIAQTLNIAPHYADLALLGMREAIPQSFIYLDRVAKFGVKHGYIEFNQRTHSRHWFKSWLEAKDYGRQLTGAQRSEIERFCKNVTMSGTQADMIKEAMVNIKTYVTANNIDYKFLLQVHDEIVSKHRTPNLRPTIEKIITDTCNLYLEGIEMKVEGFTGIFWNK